MKFHYNKNILKMLLVLFTVVVLFVGGYFLITILDNTSSVEIGTSVSETGGSADPMPTLSDRKQKDLTTLLLLGIDKEGKMEKVNSNINDAQCDFLTLILLDEKAKTYDLLQLNRDTMASVEVLGLGGVVIEKAIMQLALSHTYGNGMEESCENSVRAVERLLGGIRIDHYIALNMTGMAKLIDGIGGVTVTIQDDFSKVDPTLVQGERMLLNGSQCMTYIRSRMHVADQTNLARSERQKQFMKELLPAMQNKGSLSLQVLADISEYMLTDMSGNKLDKMINKITESEFQEIYSPAGKAVLGEEFMEFYIDETELHTLIEALFYQKTEE